jgi:hypothetical protein
MFKLTLINIKETDSTSGNNFRWLLCTFWTFLFSDVCRCGIYTCKSKPQVLVRTWEGCSRTSYRIRKQQKIDPRTAKIHKSIFNKLNNTYCSICDCLGLHEIKGIIDYFALLRQPIFTNLQPISHQQSVSPKPFHQRLLLSQMLLLGCGLTFKL